MSNVAEQISELWREIISEIPYTAEEYLTCVLVIYSATFAAKLTFVLRLMFSEWNAILTLNGYEFLAEFTYCLGGFFYSFFAMMAVYLESKKPFIVIFYSLFFIGVTLKSYYTFLDYIWNANLYWIEYESLFNFFHDKWFIGVEKKLGANMELHLTIMLTLLDTLANLIFGPVSFIVMMHYRTKVAVKNNSKEVTTKLAKKKKKNMQPIPFKAWVRRRTNNRRY